MRILFSNASLMWGGNEKWTLKAAETLAARGHRVWVAIRDPHLWDERRSRDDVTWVRLPFANDSDLVTIWRLHRLLKCERIEIFIPTRSRDYWLGGWASRGTEAKYVMRMGITRVLPNTLKERLRYGRWPHAIIVNAQAVKNSLAQHPWVKPERLHVIYNGVDSGPPPIPMEGPRGVESKTKVSRDSPNILIVAAGRIETEKGFDVLIEAMARAVHHEPRLRCEIWGEGDQRENLTNQAAQLGLQAHVTLPGFAKGTSEALARADLAVSSSYREGISNFILESWAAGVPLITTAIAGSAEIVHDRERGMLVPPGDPEAMCEAILTLIRDQELRQRCIAGGRLAIETVHNWDTMAEKMEGLFENLN